MSASGQTFQPPKAWELSLYELHRTPQEAITDDTEIALSPRSLHSELMCPICLDMLTNTMTTKECLHRFCHDCIITALRAGNKECPTCRKKLISKRSLRRDPNFDSLIEKIYPDRDEYEAQQDAVMEKLNQHTNQQALTNSIEEGLRIQAQHRLQRMLKQQRKAAAEAANQEDADPQQQQQPDPTTTDNADATTPGDADAQGTATSQKERKRKYKDINKASMSNSQTSALTSADADVPTSSMMPELDEVELIFRPHPEHVDEATEMVASRYLKTTVNAQINHLRTFLTMRLALERGAAVNNTDKSYNIFVYDGESEDHVHLAHTLTLHQVLLQYWREAKPLELFYVELDREVGDQETGEARKVVKKEEEEDGQGSEESSTITRLETEGGDGDDVQVKDEIKDEVKDEVKDEGESEGKEEGKDGEKDEE